MASRTLLEELIDWINEKRIFSKKFNIGENIDSHIKDFEKFAEEQKITDSAQLSERLLKTLNEEANLELQSMPEFRNNKLSYHWLKTKLVELYHVKSTKVTPIMNILSLKQEDMTLRQYLTTIRVAGVREMPDDDESDREKMLLSIFLKGVNNRLAARATEIMKPKTLEEAYNFMKKEDKAQYSDKLRIINNDINTEKWQEMEVLKRKIIKLEHRIKYLERNREINSPKFPAQKMKQEIKCFNCNGKGHIARSCNKPLVCTNCKKSGHISRFCKNAERPNFQKEAFRRCEETNDYSNIEYDEATCDDDKESEDNELFKIVFRKEKKSKIKKQFKRNVNYPADIIKLDKYIRGASNQFSIHREQRTMISDTKSEPAANKPIVKERVE